MKKRSFLTAGMLGLSGLAMAASDKKSQQKADCAASAAAGPGPVLLTITGAVTKANRGALDPAFDRMMYKQQLQFNRAYVFDFAALQALPQTTIRPTLEYDGKQHAISGPLMSDVLGASGAQAATEIVMRALDGYTVQIAMADVHKYRFVLGTQLDGKPLPVGGLGPLWGVFEADRFPEVMARPISARFALCPWAIYHIEAKT